MDAEGAYIHVHVHDVAPAICFSRVTLLLYFLFDWYSMRESLSLSLSPRITWVVTVGQ